MCAKGLYVCTDLHKDERSIPEGIVPLSGCRSLQRQTQIDSINTHISYTILLGENACIKVTQILVVKNALKYMR